MSSAEPDQIPACMSIKRAAKHLDMSVSSFKRQGFVGFKVGGLTRYETAMLDNWVRAKASAAAEERRINEIVYGK